MSEPDAVVVGSGPNGLMAAVVLARAGRRVTVLEAAERPGGGLRSADLVQPGVLHDVCSAIHPLALASPAFRSLAVDLERHGLQWIHAPFPVAHPLDGGRAAVLARSVAETASGLGEDAERYQSLFGPHVDAGFELTDGLLSPLSVPPAHPIHLARFGVRGIRSARALAASRFRTDEARALFAGLAAHSQLSLRSPSTGAYGMMLGVLGHLVGWPIAQGGSERIADALVGVLEEAGGHVECNHPVSSLSEFASSTPVVLDLTPRQVLGVLGTRAPERYARTLRRFRYGPGVVKVDWILDGPIPWADDRCGQASTVHVGGTLDEIVAAEDAVVAGGHPQRPYVLVAQSTRFDSSRAPEGTHTVWAYCHVPNGSNIDVSDLIQAQIERFAPGFGDRIIGAHTMTPTALERRNANCVGGDINGGSGDLRQFVARPTLGLHPWRTPVDNVWICSASTPPGGGVHGMGGWHAAHDVMHRTS